MTRPSLPPLYFTERSLLTTACGQVSLPVEVMHRCLVDYSDWGDLARLATVQRDWSTLLYDAGRTSIEAQWTLAQALSNGTNGLETNPSQAMKLLLQLANVAVDDKHAPVLPDVEVASNCPQNKPFAPAMKVIANCYLDGTGVPEANARIGVQWMKAAFHLGNDVEAAHELAVLYEQGEHGVDIDVVEAVEWFRKAAEAGHIEAMAELGLCYELGLSVEQSDEMAIEWYMKAAEGGHLTAKYSIGEAFEEARGVPQSDAEACLWYYRAAIEGDEDSRRALRRLEDIARIVLPGVGKLLDE